MEKHFIKFLKDVTWEELFEKYGGQWVNYYEGKIISHNQNLKKADYDAEQILKHKKYVGIYVKPEWGRKICLPIYFKTVNVHPWKPSIEASIGIIESELVPGFFLVDSGADISVISKEFGEKLGLNISQNETIFSASGVGGGVLKYVERDLFLKINDKTIKIPVAWIQDERYTEMIIGREVVFDSFDIEFKQADEQVIFKPRI